MTPGTNVAKKITSHTKFMNTFMNHQVNHMALKQQKKRILVKTECLKHSLCASTITSLP